MRALLGVLLLLPSLAWGQDQPSKEIVVFAETVACSDWATFTSRTFQVPAGGFLLDQIEVSSGQAGELELAVGVQMNSDLLPAYRMLPAQASTRVPERRFLMLAPKGLEESYVFGYALEVPVGGRLLLSVRCRRGEWPMNSTPIKITATIRQTTGTPIPPIPIPAPAMK